MSAAPHDFVVIGSGAAGGPLAANLARAGYRVLLLEAGGEDPGPLYDVPAFHAYATEDPQVRWDFYVQHRGGSADESGDANFNPERGGFWYPRASTLGGCTAHNAMITVIPPDSDWDYMARLTGDDSWSGENMRRYWARLESCRYRSRSSSGSGHGFDGWLPTENADNRPGFSDPALLRMVLAAMREAGGTSFVRMLRGFDANDRALARKRPTGMVNTPLATQQGRRRGSREFVKKTAAECSGLEIRANSLATRVRFDAAGRATGVEYVQGRHLYWASPQSDRDAALPPPSFASAAREVIVCGGVFNSPQLMMLSGLGDAAELESLGIRVIADVPGVGRNLQDHYEFPVVTRMSRPFRALRSARFDVTTGDRDPAYQAWLRGKGPYTSSGVVIGVLHQSQAADPADGPDLYLYGAPCDFHGYFHGYADRIKDTPDHFTWVVLKARMGTHAGRVRLASSDPRCPPQIDFAYFPAGDSAADRDLEAMVEGVRLAQRIAGRATRSGQVWPRSTAGEFELRELIRSRSWGHHACGTLRMGPAGDPLSVVDSRFRVRGVAGLRVVDASIFPRIPGHFLAAPTYMIAEKAADTIREDCGR